MATDSGGHAARGIDPDTVERLREAVAAATATVTSADHAVTVTVAPGNAVTALELGSRATRPGGAAALGPAIVAAIAQAVAQVNARLAADVDRIAPGRGGLAGTLGRLPEPPRPPEQEAEPVDDLADELDGVLPPGFTGPDGAATPLSSVDTRLLGRLRERSAATLAGYAQLAGELADQPTAVRSSDGTVTVTVLPGGAVRSIDVDERALRHGPGNLARMVLSALHQAGAESALRVAGRVQELAGPALQVRAMVESYVPEGLRPDPAGSEIDPYGFGRQTGGRR